MSGLLNPTDETQWKYWEAEHGFRRYDHLIVRFFAEQRLDHIAQVIPWTEIRCALDVGCGDGFSSFYTAQRIKRLVAGDRSVRMLSCHPRVEVDLTAFDAYDLPFGDNSFDLVYGWEILHHIAAPERVVKEMRRVAKKYVVLFEPNRYSPPQAAFALLDREHRWVLRYSKSYLKGLAESAGLKVARVETVGCIFPNKTPYWLFQILCRIPFQVPVVGISNFVVGAK